MTQLLPPAEPSTEMMGLDEAGSKIGIGLMVGGGLALIAGAILYFWKRRSELGQVTVVTPPVHAGGMTLTHYRDKKLPIDERLRLLQDLTWQSVQDPRNRKLALGLTRNCPDRDEKCETRAVYDAIKKRVRYTGDVAAVKMGSDGPVEGIDLFQSAFRTWEFEGGDCLPVGTLLLTEDNRLVAIQNIQVGTRIWGYDKWTTVKKVWAKGKLPTDVLVLSNGQRLRATGDHKVYVAVCTKHPTIWETGKCDCPMSDRDIKRIHVSEVQPHMVLLSPGQIPHIRDQRVAELIYVDSITRNFISENVYDITTKDHYVYLPEADVTVSNCDDHSVLAATLLSLNGIPAKFRVTATKKGQDFSHIYTMAGIPKMRPTKWVAIDTTLPGDRYGYEVPYAKKQDYPA